MNENPTSQLFIQIKDTPRPRQELAEIGLDDARLLDTLAQFDLFGAWRVDLSSGLVYWSRDTFEIHGLPYKEGPIDIYKALEAYHPDDRPLVRECFAEAIERKTGFRYVMRMKVEGGDYRLVAASGMYRVNGQGDEEVFGTFYLFQDPVRAVAVGS